MKYICLVAVGLLQLWALDDESGGVNSQSKAWICALSRPFGSVFAFAFVFFDLLLAVFIG